MLRASLTCEPGMSPPSYGIDCAMSATRYANSPRATMAMPTSSWVGCRWRYRITQLALRAWSRASTDGYLRLTHVSNR